MDYYSQVQYIAQVDKNDRIIGKIEKWEAHKKGVLHRMFTTIITYKNQFILQHRKHPVFDGVFDLSFSSHQIYKNATLQTDLAAIYDGLKREWNLDKKDLTSQPKFLKKIYYRAKDPQSDYIEHEVGHIYRVYLKKIPSPSFDFAYGFSLIEKNKILNSKFLILNSILAPWVKVMIEEKLLELRSNNSVVK